MLGRRGDKQVLYIREATVYMFYFLSFCRFACFSTRRRCLSKEKDRRSRTSVYMRRYCCYIHRPRWVTSRACCRLDKDEMMRRYHRVFFFFFFFVALSWLCKYICIYIYFEGENRTLSERLSLSRSLSFNFLYTFFQNYYFDSRRRYK